MKQIIPIQDNQARPIGTPAKIIIFILVALQLYCQAKGGHVEVGTVELSWLPLYCILTVKALYRQFGDCAGAPEESLIAGVEDDLHTLDSVVLLDLRVPHGAGVGAVLLGVSNVEATLESFLAVEACISCPFAVIALIAIDHVLATAICRTVFLGVIIRSAGRWFYILSARADVGLIAIGAIPKCISSFLGCCFVRTSL